MGLLFREVPYLIGNLAIQAIGCAGGLAIFIASMIVCRGVITPSHTKPSCFGFRWAALIFTIARLLTALQVGIPDAARVPRAFGVMNVFCVLLSVIAEVMIVYALIKTILHPLRAHGAFPRDTLIASLLTGLLGLVGLAVTAGSAVGAAAYLQYSSYSSRRARIPLSVAYRVQDIIGLLYDVVGTAIGITMVVFSVYAMRKVRHLPVEPKQRTMPYKTLAASVVWLLSFFLVTIIDGVLSQSDFSGSDDLVANFGALLNVDVFFSRLMPLVVFTLLIFCHRGHPTQVQGHYAPQQVGYMVPPPQGYVVQPNNFPPQQQQQPYGTYPVYAGYPAPGQPVYYPMPAAPAAGANKNVPMQAQVQPVAQPMPGQQQYQQHPAGSVSPQSSPPASTPYSPPPVPRSPDTAPRGGPAQEMPTRDS